MGGPQAEFLTAFTAHVSLPAWADIVNVSFSNFFDLSLLLLICSPQWDIFYSTGPSRYINRKKKRWRRRGRWIHGLGPHILVSQKEIYCMENPGVSTKPEIIDWSERLREKLSEIAATMFKEGSFCWTWTPWVLWHIHVYRQLVIHAQRRQMRAWESEREWERRRKGKNKMKVDWTRWVHFNHDRNLDKPSSSLMRVSPAVHKPKVYLIEDLEPRPSDFLSFLVQPQHHPVGQELHRPKQIVGAGLAPLSHDIFFFYFLLSLGDCCDGQKCTQLSDNDGEMGYTWSTLERGHNIPFFFLALRLKYLNIVRRTWWQRRQSRRLDVDSSSIPRSKRCKLLLLLLFMTNRVPPLSRPLFAKETASHLFLAPFLPPFSTNECR